MTATTELAPPPAADLRIEPRYVPRPARFLRLATLGDWTLKIYGLATPGNEARRTLVDATVAVAGEALPRPAVTADRYGVGFAIAHDASAICFALLYWWQGGNELHQRVFKSPHDDPGCLTKLIDPGAGCVFELGIIDFERRAWRDDVLSGPSPHLDRYLSRRFTGEV